MTTKSTLYTESLIATSYISLHGTVNLSLLAMDIAMASLGEMLLSVARHATAFVHM